MLLYRVQQPTSGKTLLKSFSKIQNSCSIRCQVQRGKNQIIKSFEINKINMLKKLLLIMGCGFGQNPYKHLKISNVYSSSSLLGDQSDIVIDSLIQAESNTHKHIFAPGDCFVVWFDKPVLNDQIQCQWTSGSVLCSKLSGNALLLKVLVNNESVKGRFTDTITGSIGKIVNPISLTLQKIDFYPGCLSKSDPSV